MKQVNGLFPAVAAITLICVSGRASFALEAPRPIGGQAAVWVETDRFIYRPGEKGAVTVTASNATDQEARVEVVLIAGVGAAKPLCTVSVPAGARKEQKAEFATDGLQWGCEVLARASVGGKVRAQASDYFAVADGPWQVAVMSAWPPDREQWETPEGARAVAAKMRADGFNGYEAFFWGECDLLDFTPDTE
ncbi:MAG TPA: hypothetical protein VM186_14240, partial [Planctomycetota bacterium]|nr:hypothetical protein [Planctomycetota bacterium]